MKRYTILLFWITGMLLPLTWAGRLFPWLRAELAPIMRPLISPEWVHIIAHTGLYAGFIILVAYALKLELTVTNIFLLLTVVLTLGLGQEGLQLIVKQRSFGGPEVFDMLVDLFGGMLGILIWKQLISIKWLRFAV